MTTKFDAIVIGGGISGLITTLILSGNGYRVLLVEKEQRLGGTNNSFRNRRGDSFDFGYHTLDCDRSPFATRFFSEVLHGQFHTFALKRGIAIKGHTMPYNAPISEWPEAIRRSVEKTEFVDTIDGPPTRESLASIYGDYLAGLALNEILPSYPTLFWQLKNGKPESDLMDQVYPWFFPKSIKQSIGKHEWNRFHQKVRDQGEHMVMYPSIGGFGGFIDAIVKKIDTQKARIVQGFSKLDVSIDPDSQKIRSIDLDGVTYQADQYFWCAPLAIVGRLLGVPFPSAHPQMLCLGSFVFERELPFAYHEILVGERGVPINRISFPGKIAGGKNDKAQVEFAYPLGEMVIEENTWVADSHSYLEKLGLLQQDNPLIDYHFFGANKGFVSTHDPLKMLADFRASLRHSTNIVYPYIGLEVDSISRIIPSVFREVYRAITA
ncbi:protoporphyrinogen oxidase [Afipia massiliensis]|uniref:Protoporphyrinogen oxidase n=1 Tax=Afipia massiliensis TaxID=211460 RepID=A0A840N930_9BRAD|nr:FAD-dependent oxidoreductase [Afipia massiliensis]MBB5054211.1 protoporphyrinogen oxidase [Afipia massiliensis]